MPSRREIKQVIPGEQTLRRGKRSLQPIVRLVYQILFPWWLDLESQKAVRAQWWGGSSKICCAVDSHSLAHVCPCTNILLCITKKYSMGFHSELLRRLLLLNILISFQTLEPFLFFYSHPLQIRIPFRNVTYFSLNIVSFFWLSNIELDLVINRTEAGIVDISLH